MLEFLAKKLGILVPSDTSHTLEPATTEVAGPQASSISSIERTKQLYEAARQRKSKEACLGALDIINGIAKQGKKQCIVYVDPDAVLDIKPAVIEFLKKEGYTVRESSMSTSVYVEW